MMGNKARDFQELPRVSLESLVPADHFYRHLHTALDLSFVRGLVSDRYSPIGRPGVDPVVFFKLQLVMFFEGIRSERQLIRMVQDRLSLRWYLGYDLHEPLPDHSSLTRIRERYGLDVFRRFFERVVELCREAGLVWGEELFFDATKVRANADLDSLEPRFYHNARRHVDALFADPPSQRVGVTSAEPTQGPPPEPLSAAGPLALPVQRSGEERIELEAENRGRWRLLDECRLDPGRPPSGPYRRITDLRVSATDPDAAPMSDGRKPSLGYHDHYVVDGGKARVILGCLVTPGDVMENAPMLDLLWRVRFRWKLHPRCAVGDTTYGTGENIRAVEEAGIRAYVPLTDFEAGSPFYRHADFTYDADEDVYTCPHGAILRPRGNCYTTRTRAYQAPREACASCPLRSRCTESSQGRRLNRHFDEGYRERVRGYHQTEPYKRAMSKRKVWVEPLFGEAKEWHGLRRFRLRGLWKVNVEGLMVATGQNLKRLLSHTGWGRRPYPGGAAGRALSLPPPPPHPSR